jgi:hypothetical protein
MAAMRMSNLAGLGLTFVLALGGSAAARDWFEIRGVPPPEPDRIYVCHGYTCRIATPVRISAADLEQIAGPLIAGTADAAEERAAISSAVQAFETIVGERIGTSGDLPKMQFGQGSPDQMDCIDEATNTTALLRLLAHHGYLRHHRVMQPSARGFFIDLRYPHATAVLAETATGNKWAVDSWPRANSEPPVIQLLSEWKRARSSDDLPS